jgi:ATP-dependent protease ClpP protease subunit
LITNIENITHNFVSTEGVFIFDELSTETSSYLISDFIKLINCNAAKKDIDVYINSPGGDVYTLTSLLSCFKLANAQNISINTYNIGLAASCGSLLAICGNKRYMHKKARHFVHFGQVYNEVSKSSEIEKAKEYMKNHEDFIKSLYLENTKITLEQLNKLIVDEYGWLSAQQCKKLGFCDIIL